MSGGPLKHCVVDEAVGPATGPEAVPGRFVTGAHGLGRIGAEDQAGSVMIEVVCQVVMTTDMLTAGTINAETARQLAEDFVERSAIIIQEVGDDLAALMSGEASN